VIAIATTSGSAAWAADEAALPPATYKLECPRFLADTAGPARRKSVGLGDRLREGASGPDLRLRGHWLVDTRASLGGETFYSLEQQVAYFVAHEPSLVVKLPEPLAHTTPPRIELATLELHLPF
jgi:hypothetical protein